LPTRIFVSELRLEIGSNDSREGEPDFITFRCTQCVGQKSSLASDGDRNTAFGLIVPRALTAITAFAQQPNIVHMMARATIASMQMTVRRPMRFMWFAELHEISAIADLVDPFNRRRDNGRR
jgi:hypothetical protein